MDKLPNGVRQASAHHRVEDEPHLGVERAVLRISMQALARLLLLPPGLKAVGARYDDYSDRLFVKIEGRGHNLPLVFPGMQAIALDPVYRETADGERVIIELESLGL